MFPLSRHGSIRVQGATAMAAVMRRIEELLASTSALPVRRRPSSIDFVVSGRMWSWNLLAPVTRGRIDVLQDGAGFRVAYELRFTTMLALSMAFPAFAGSTLLHQWIGGEPYRAGPLAASAALWLWIVGGNYLTCTIRVHRWLRQGLRGLPLPPPPPISGAAATGS